MDYVREHCPLLTEAEIAANIADLTVAREQGFSRMDVANAAAGYCATEICVECIIACSNYVWQ